MSGSTLHLEMHLSYKYGQHCNREQATWVMKGSSEGTSEYQASQKFVKRERECDPSMKRFEKGNTKGLNCEFLKMNSHLGD